MRVYLPLLVNGNYEFCESCYRVIFISSTTVCPSDISQLLLINDPLTVTGDTIVTRDWKDDHSPFGISFFSNHSIRMRFQCIYCGNKITVTIFSKREPKIYFARIINSDIVKDRIVLGYCWQMERSTWWSFSVVSHYFCFDLLLATHSNITDWCSCPVQSYLYWTHSQMNFRQQMNSVLCPWSQEF